MPKLQIKWGNKEEEKELVGDFTTIGRANDNVIQFKNIKISRRHCQIIKTLEGYKIADAGSSNGIFVNGVRVENQLLQNKDLIRLGDVEITFLAEAAVAPEVPASGQVTEPVMLEIPEVIPEPASELSVPQEPIAVSEPTESQVQPTAPTSEPKFVDQENEEQSTGEETTMMPTVCIQEASPSASRFSRLAALPKKGKGSAKRKGVRSSRTSRLRKINKSDGTEADKGPAKSGSKTIIFVAVGLVLLAVVILIFVVVKPFGEKGDSSLKAQEKLIDQAEECVQKEDYRRALNLYQRFLKRYKRSQYTKSVKKAIGDLEERQASESKASRAWQSLKKRIEDTPVDQSASLLKEVKAFINTHHGTQAAKEAEGEIERIERYVASSGPEESDFNELSYRIGKVFIPKKEFDKALREWDKFLKKYPNMSKTLHTKVQFEINRINKMKQE